MLKHIPTNTIYNNRKEAKLAIGTWKYFKAVKNGEIEYLSSTEDTK